MMVLQRLLKWEAVFDGAARCCCASTANPEATSSPPTMRDHGRKSPAFGAQFAALMAKVPALRRKRLNAQKERSVKESLKRSRASR
jgi:hypothetical protein